MVQQSTQRTGLARNNSMRKRNIQIPPQDASLSLPDSLVTRCAVLYVWDEEYALRALEGYLQFVELKANFEDWDCEHLAPSVVIDLVWQQHLLYNKQYYQACEEYCGNLIGYDAEASLHADSPSQEQRIKTTKIALKALYGRSYDADVWSFLAASGMNKGLGKGIPNNRSFSTASEPKESMHAGGHTKLPTAIKAPALIANPRYNDSRQDPDDSDGYRIRGRAGASSSDSICHDETISDSEASDMRLAILASQQLHQEQEQVSHSANEQDSRLPSSHHDNNKHGIKSSDSVTVKIKCFIDGKTQDTCIRVKRTTKMKKVEDCLAKLMNLESADNLRFMIDGEQVSPWQTLESMKVVDPEQHWFTVMPKSPNFQ